MILSKKLSSNFTEWNKKWVAPNNIHHFSFMRELIKIDLVIPFEKLPNVLYYLIPHIGGIFSFQRNSKTREVEYPAVYFATNLDKSMKVVEIGGGLSGFQFVLSKQGLSVQNVDPGDPEYNWNYTQRQHYLINKAFGTNVQLISKSIDQVDIESNSVDRVFCISVVEHLKLNERKAIAENIYRIIKPGGYAIFTADLFLDIFPFTKKKQNRWGANASIYEFIKTSKLKLVKGNKKELFGFPEFEKSYVLENLSHYCLGDWPVVSQLFVLQK